MGNAKKNNYSRPYSNPRWYEPLIPCGVDERGTKEEFDYFLSHQSEKRKLLAQTMEEYIEDLNWMRAAILDINMSLETEEEVQCMLDYIENSDEDLYLLDFFAKEKEICNKREHLSQQSDK